MSVQAIGWVLDCSQSRGNDRLVALIMHHYAQEGFSWLSRAVLCDESRLSESTVNRCQTTLVTLGEIRECHPDDAPADYRAIPANRRPRVFELVGFLDSPFADSIHRRRGVKSRGLTGARLGRDRGAIGVAGTPPDQDIRALISNRRSDNSSFASCLRCGGAAVYWDGQKDRPCDHIIDADVPAAPPPWIAAGQSRDDWMRSNA